MVQKQATTDLVVPCIIGGNPVSLPDSQNFPVIEGKTGNIVHYAQSATVEVAVNAVEVAAKAFKSWRRVPVVQRRDILNKAADIIVSKTEDAVKRETAETSCEPAWPVFDCSFAATSIRQNAATAMSVCGSIPPTDDSAHTSLIFKEPVGVVLVIPP